MDDEQRSTHALDSTVLDRIRHILAAYLLFWRKSTGRRYSALALASDISAFIDPDAELLFDDNRISNFVFGYYPKGWPTDGPKKRTDPDDDLLSAIVDWLTDETSKGYFCPREDLLRADRGQAAFFSQEFINNAPLTGDVDGADLWRQARFAARADGVDGARALLLWFEALHANGALSVSLADRIWRDDLSDEIRMEPLESGTEFSTGWAVRWSNAELLLNLRHTRTGAYLPFLLRAEPMPDTAVGALPSAFSMRPLSAARIHGLAAVPTHVADIHSFLLERER